MNSLVMNGQCFSTKSVTFGVPQGSILGPLLCVISLSDLSFEPERNLVLFVDEMIIILHGKDDGQLHALIKRARDKAFELFTANEFKLN